jgi:hypothetical protein
VPEEQTTCPLCGDTWCGWSGEWSANDYADHKGPKYKTVCCGASDWVFYAYKKTMPTRPGERRGERPHSPVPFSGPGWAGRTA